MNSRLKLAVIMPLAEQRGGGELMLTHAVKFSDPCKVEWFVIFLESGPMVAEYEALGIRTFVVLGHRLRNPISYLRAIIHILRIARREGISAVCSWMAKGHVYGGIAALFAGIPSFWYQLGIDSSRFSLDRVASRIRTNGIITLSRACQEAQKKFSPRTQIRLVYPGADLSQFAPRDLPSLQATREKLNLPVNQLIIGIAGRLQRWKGMHTLIATMPKIREAFPALTCVIVGGAHALEPEYPDQLSTLARNLGVADCVQIVVLQVNVNEWLHAMDVVVHASDNEPFGIVVVEAMALGKPLVAGSNGGPAEIITDGVDGLLAPFEDPDALAACIMRLLGNPEFAAQIGRGAEKRARDFSAETYAANLVGVIQEFSKA